MRIALLSSLELIEGGDPLPRAFVRIAGRSVLMRQLDLAIALGCERVACLCAGLSPDVIEVQHAAEKAGVRFNAIASSRSLSGLVKAADDLLVVADGLAFDGNVAVERLADSRRVLTLSAEDAVPSGFERIDRDRAWAGLMIVGGQSVEALAELPADIDPVSSLLRIALQNGARTSQIPTALMLENEWSIIGSAEQAENFEGKWLDKTVKPIGFAAPIAAMAERLAKLAVRRHRKPLQTSRIAAGLGGMALLAGASAVWFEYPVAGIGAALIAWFALRFSTALGEILATHNGGGGTSNKGRWIGPIAIDLLLIFAVSFAVPAFDRGEALFSAFTLLGLLRLYEYAGSDGRLRGVGTLLSDRGLLSAGLAAIVLAGVAIPAIQIFAAVLMLAIIVKTLRPELTRT